jgi:hypothetical protein
MGEESVGTPALNKICHPERSEGPDVVRRKKQVLRFAQDDNPY